VLKSELLRTLQGEIRRHTFDYFVENPPAMADGGHGVVVPGCRACRKRINTIAPTRIQAAFDDPDFVWELKHDGFRAEPVRGR
jgi:hypothetical protein